MGDRQSKLTGNEQKQNQNNSSTQGKAWNLKKIKMKPKDGCKSDGYEIDD